MFGSLSTTSHCLGNYLLSPLFNNYFLPFKILVVITKFELYKNRSFTAFSFLYFFCFCTIETLTLVLLLLLARFMSCWKAFIVLFVTNWDISEENTRHIQNHIKCCFQFTYFTSPYYTILYGIPFQTGTFHSRSVLYTHACRRERAMRKNASQSRFSENVRLSVTHATVTQFGALI